MEITKEEKVSVSVMGLALMYPCFAMFGLIDLVTTPIRFVNDRVKNKNGESITSILTDAFKNAVNKEA